MFERSARMIVAHLSAAHQGSASKKSAQLEFNSLNEVGDVKTYPEQRQSCASRVNIPEHLAPPRARTFHAGAAN